MRALAEMPRGQAAAISILFSDIDDTLSSEGRITAEAYAALWRAHDAGLKVVPVTGRPAGWCDHIARMWPVHGVIGENGGLVFRMAGGRMERHFLYDGVARAAMRERLAVIREHILREIPGCAVASDQAYREYDLAIDFCEDVPHLPRDQVLRIQAIFAEHGATAKISSIHVNGWFGSFDKLTAARAYLMDHLGLDPDEESTQSSCAFAGDSPNDEPMFSFFHLNSTGVANLLDFSDLLVHHPAWITPSRGGAGFAELVDHLLSARLRSPD